MGNLQEKTNEIDSQAQNTVDTILRIILFGLLSIISLLAINIQFNIIDIQSLSAAEAGYSKFLILMEAYSKALNSVNLTQIISGIVIIALYSRNILSRNANFSITAFITSGIFSIFMITGRSLSLYQDFSFIIASKYQTVIALTVLLGYWGILYTGIRELILILDKIKINDRQYHGLLGEIDKHLFPLSVIVILLGWSPYVIINLPGSITFDGWFQLNMFYGLTPLNRHHPVCSTLLIGAIVKFGDLIGGTDFGIFLYVILQSIFCAIIYGSICKYLREKKMPLSFVIGVALFFAIVPVWGAYAQVVIKDTLYAAIFAWFILELVKLYLGDGGKYGIIKLMIAAVCVCLFRNDGIYVAVIALLVLLILIEKKKGIVVTLITVLIFGVGINSLLLDQLGIDSYTPIENTNSTAEAMSVPFLQIARYVRDYGDELTEEEIQTIDAVLDYSSLAENYNPQSADAVKTTYRNTATSEDWKAFIQLWAQKFIKHPDAYVIAAADKMYGYVDPFEPSNNLYYFYIRGKITEDENEPNYVTYIFPEELRNIISIYSQSWQEIPILSCFVNCGAYTWLGILLLALAIRKRNWKDALIFLIPAINVIICFVSPVNGYLRYFLPIMSAMPLYIFIGLRSYLFPKESVNVESDLSS